MHRNSQDANNAVLRQPRTEHFPEESIALPKLINRTVEVDVKEWDTLHHKSKEQNTLTNSHVFGRGLFWRNGFPILSPTSQLYWFWSLYVLLMDATYTAFVVPITVGFDASDEVWNWAGYLDFVAGCTFAVELLLGWNVAYVATHKHRKRMVLKRTRIACFYVFKGTFVFDIIATSVFIAQAVGYGLGLASSHGGTIIQIIQIARVLRLLRLLGLLQQLFVLSLIAPQRVLPLVGKPLPTWLAYLIPLLYLVAVFINFMACLWVFVAQREGYEDTWINNYSPFVSEYAADASASLLTSQEARAIPGPRVYLAAAYWSLTTVSTIGFGDVTPITDAERAVLLLLELTGVLFFGILLSSITSLLQRASEQMKEAETFRNKMSSVQKWMIRLQLPHELRVKIRQYYAEVWIHQADEQNGLQMFQDLPQHIRGQVVWWRVQNIMGKMHAFKGLDTDLQFLIAVHAKPHKVAAGHQICAEGAPADSIWMLHEGSAVALYHLVEAQIEHAPVVLGVTALLALTNDRYKIRQCGYRALESCMLWEVSMADMQPIMEWQQDLAAHLTARAQEHVAHRKSVREKLWRKSIVQEEDEDVMQDAGGIDASDNTILQYNSSSHQAAMLNLAEIHKQDSLPALQPGSQLDEQNVSQVKDIYSTVQISCPQPVCSQANEERMLTQRCIIKYVSGRRPHAST
ncbi:hypothetical protein WJX82_001510 [Trebouxia sp. C0006]